MTRIFSLLLVFSLFNGARPATVFSSSLKTCQTQCDEQNLAFPLEDDKLTWNLANHNYSEFIASCKKGCDDVNDRDSRCDETCSSEEVITSSCKQGCRAVLHAFLAQAQALLVQSRINMEIMEENVKLKLEFPEEIAQDLKEIATADVFWFAQTRPLHGTLGWRWTSLPAGSFRNSSCTAEVNVPFEMAPNFEVRLALSYRSQVLVSRSTSYQMPASKVGTTIEIIGQLQLSEQKVAVCYRTSQPVVRLQKKEEKKKIQPKFKISTATLDGNALNTEETTSRCHLFSNLPTENCCQVGILAIEPSGLSTAELNLKLDYVVNQVEAQLTSEVSRTMVFTNGSHLLEAASVDDFLLTESASVIIFDLPLDDSITAITGYSESSIIIGSQKGSMWAYHMNRNDTDQEQPSTVIKLKNDDETDTKITQVIIDFTQNFVFAVQHDKGIYRCKIRSTSEEEISCLLMVPSDILNPPRQISIDPINGYIYALHADSKVYQIDYPDFESNGLMTVSNSKAIHELSPSNAIFFDLNKFSLISSLKNGTILERNMISDSLKTLQEHGPSEITCLIINSNRMYYKKEKCGEAPIDEICIFAKPLDAEEGEQKRYLHANALLDFAILEDVFIKPRLVSVTSLSMITNSTMAKISWVPPTPLLFQDSSESWRNTSYVVTISTIEPSENLPLEIHTNLTELTIPLTSTAPHRVRVRQCSGEFCSSVIETTGKLLENATPLVLMRRDDDGVVSYDLLGNKVLEELDPTVKQLGKMSTAAALDNSTKLVYVPGDNLNGIFRRDLFNANSTRKLVFDAINTEEVSVMSSRAIVIVSSPYHILAYRMTGTFDFEYYTCEEPLEDCAEVVSVHSDDVTGEVFFLTQARNGTVFLFKSTADRRIPEMISSTNKLPSIRKIAKAGDSFIFLTKGGHIAQTDLSLTRVNELMVPDLFDSIVEVSDNGGNNSLQISGDLKFTEGSKTQLMWGASSKGGLLYKVMLFREKMGLEAPIVNVQLETTYTIPSDILTLWSSAQRFDVSVQVISPWTSTIINRTGMLAPVKPPTSPVDLKIYANQQKTVDGPRALIWVFWSPPVEWNGTPYQYVVNCTKDDGTWIGGYLSSTQTYYSFAVKSGKVDCQLAAANEPSNIGAFSTPISIDSSELRPLVKLFAIDASDALVAITNLTHDGPRIKKRQSGKNVRLEYQVIASVGDDLFALRKEGDSVQPFLVQIDTNHFEDVVHKVSVGGDVTHIDAMTSDWVGNRLFFVTGSILYQLSLEPFHSTSLLNPHKVIELTSTKHVKQIAFDPFKNTIYLLNAHGKLISLDLTDKKETRMNNNLQCLSTQNITWMSTEFAWNRASSPKIYVLTSNGLSFVDLYEGNQCHEVKIDWTQFREKGGLLNVTSFAIADKLFAFVTNEEMLIYDKDKLYPIPVTNAPLKKLLAVSQSSQPYPDRSCFELPSSNNIQFTIINEGKTGAFLEVTKPVLPSSCQRVSMPQTQYEVYFTRKNTDKVKHVRSFTDKIHVENGILDKETDYDVTVTWLNRYSPSNGISAPKPFRTGFGYPSAPRDPHAIAVSPDIVYLHWSLPETLNAPISEIRYKISQQAAGLPTPTTIAVIPLSDMPLTNVSSDSTSCLINPCRVKITNLRPSNEYKFWITAMHVSHLESTFLHENDAVSSETVAKTLDVPGTLRMDNATGSSLLLRWNGLQPENPPSIISVQYKETGENIEWKSPSNATFDPNVTSILVLINNLLSATAYDFRFVGSYSGTFTIDGKVIAYKEDYFQGVQQVRTKAGVPTAPQNVEWKMDLEGWIVVWKDPISDGGSPITSYAVEMRENNTAEWEIADRGLDGWKHWWRPPKTTKITHQYEFRVRAANVEGFGSYANSEEHKPPEEEEESSDVLTYVLIFCIALLCVALLFLICFLLRARQEARLKKREAEDEKNCIRLEQFTSMSMSDTGNFPPEINNEVKNLPHMNNEDVKTVKVIAEGAFGLVEEAIAEQVPLSWEKNVRVAVKNLRESHTYSQKISFMQEAILLNNIEHPNIVRQLGVCFEGSKIFMVLELMEGGSLLDFLRESVPTENQASDLSLRDLLRMAADVSRAMSYLERLPHVHRDVCARNCLISSREGPLRITKLELSLGKGVENQKILQLGAFYNDKVRWMAPEVLREQNFSSASDSWAFGVFLFEIFSLGLIPYSEMDNKAAINFVRNGGVLNQPMFCPDRLYKLMQLCWAFDPQKRPKFSHILKNFETFREKLEFQDDKPLQLHDGHFNINFDGSHDSTSSERGPEKCDPSQSTKSFGGFEHTNYDRPSFESSQKKMTKPAAVRSLRKEKAKRGNSASNLDDHEARQPRPLSIHSTDTISTDYGGATSSSMHSPTYQNHPNSVFNLPSNLHTSTSAPNDLPKSRLSAAPAIGMNNDGFEGSTPRVSFNKSWTATGNRPVSTVPRGTSRARSGNNLQVPAPSYETSVRNRVSQV